MSGYIQCRSHGKRQLGYVACVHVLEQGAPVRYREDATASDPGLVLCRSCHEKGENAVPMNDLLTVCARCLKERALG